MADRSHLLTEQRLPESLALDTMSIPEAVALMNAQDALAVAAVAAQRANITRAIELVVTKLRAGGRLFYVAAGSSGRLGVQDATECPPTFSTDPSMVQALLAGGNEAVFQSREGAEDSAAGGAAAIDAVNAGPTDAVLGIAAGGTTPFVHGALRRAIARGAGTIFLSCVQRLPEEPPVDVVIRTLTGPEVVTGSTRLKAGTATKLVLNTLSTVAMVQLGKVYENLMVDLKATNEKLWDRAARIVRTLTGLEREEAMHLLRQADGEVKVAVVMRRRGIGPAEARAMLTACGGRLREALNLV